MKHDRSDKREVIYRYVVSFIRRKGYGPTYRDIMHDCELSSTSVARYNVQRLINARRLVADEGVARSLRLP